MSTANPTKPKRRSRKVVAAAAVPLVLGASFMAAVPANAAPQAKAAQSVGAPTPAAGILGTKDGRATVSLAWKLPDDGVGDDYTWPQTLAPGGVVPVSRTSMGWSAGLR